MHKDQENFFLMNRHNVVMSSSYAPNTIIWGDETIVQFNFTEKEQIVLDEAASNQHEFLFEVHKHIKNNHDYFWGGNNLEFRSTTHFPNHIIDVAPLNDNLLLGKFFFFA